MSIVWESSYTVVFPGSGYPGYHDMYLDDNLSALTSRVFIHEHFGIPYRRHNLPKDRGD